MFGTNQFTSFGSTDIFIAKYDPNGNCLWAKQAGGIYNDWGYNISVDSDGNSLFTGRFIGPVSFGTIQLAGYGSWDVFIAKYDGNGNCIWAKQAGGSSTDEGYGISLDQKGKSYITGRFSGNATFGNIHLSTYGGADIYIAEYDTNGNCLWAKQGGGINPDRGLGISVDVNANSYVTGFFKGMATFDTVQLSGYSNNDIFIAKYDPYGNCLWAKQAGGSGDDVGNSISADPYGNGYVTGYFLGNVTFGTFQLTGFGNNDMFVAKYDPQGNCLWTQKAGGTYNDRGNGISLDASGNGYVSGVFQETASFGTLQLSGGGAFITKISNNSVPVELSSFTGTSANNTVRLEWVTITETNNNFFNIEKKDPNELWRIIGEIKGAGNSLVPRKYSFYDKEIPTNRKYSYRLKQIDYNGQYKYSAEIEVEIKLIPKEYSLQQNFPNPFNPSTVINYSVPRAGQVILKLYNILGKEIALLINEFKEPGNYYYEFIGKNLNSGVYLYKFQAGNFVSVKKMIMIK
jgi:hypothetical protein